MFIYEFAPASGKHSMANFTRPRRIFENVDLDAAVDSQRFAGSTFDDEHPASVVTGEVVAAPLAVGERQADRKNREDACD